MSLEALEGRHLKGNAPVALRMARLGITGATGFIGGALVPASARAGHHLVLVDDRSGPVLVEHSDHPALNTSFFGPTGLKALADCDVILHLGAVSGVMACARDPAGTARTNVEGTRMLVSMAIERRIPIAFASSLSVVGSPENLPVTEATPARPTHEYARQKAEGERIVETLTSRAAVPSAVVRMSNVYGSYRAGSRVVSKPNVLTLFTRQVREGRITVNAPGTQRRDFIHIEDVVSHWGAVVGWLRRESSETPGSQVFNVASGESIGILELAQRVQSAYTRQHPDSRPPVIDVVKNPREGIELVDPEFRVSRALTDRLLKVGCRYSVENELNSVSSPA